MTSNAEDTSININIVLNFLKGALLCFRKLFRGKVYKSISAAFRRDEDQLNSSLLKSANKDVRHDWVIDHSYTAYRIDITGVFDVTENIRNTLNVNIPLVNEFTVKLGLTCKRLHKRSDWSL